MYAHALTIAGSDSSGGAGIQADLKTFSALGVYGMSVITAVTAQNTQGVSGIQQITPELIAQQLEAIFTDLDVHAVKIGMVACSDSIFTIAESLKKFRPPFVVLDPVMIAKSGDRLLEAEAKEALVEHLFPLATIITPNLPEAETILGRPISNLEEMKQAGQELRQLGPRYVLMKGGHLLAGKEQGIASDLLITPDEILQFDAPYIETKNTHGTGCTLAAAITSLLARGYTMEEATGSAKTYLSKAIEASLDIGQGHGPVHHFHEWFNGRRGVSCNGKPV